MNQIIHSPEALGSAIKRQRKLKGLNQKEAGTDFRIEQSTISSIEQGAAGTRLETLFRLLAALDLELIVRPKQTLKHPGKEEW